ncbi:SDR family NAD(P)-dependent oxidoreductase [Paracidobacterium acidisoli]|uniref:SDR family oxidoreductase n=1 Tax=Paracidobacterium acidisoli TaxID=2303751 RepID=A0A372IUW6_9BACT|nr:SDR family oxidoreductase [Paracidobacterium acidisoli]MBT9330047.1 SDR family oxidoreductase [Paracidobacterium acidisoli]
MAESVTAAAEDRFARYPSLQERVVLVTGGGSGIGASLVEHFAHQGAKVAFLDIAREASEALAAGLAGEVRHTPLFLPCDIREIAALQRAIGEAAERLGPVGVLVNNAARDDRHTWAEVTPEYWDEMMAVNLRHHFFAIQAVAPGMKALGGGSIINLSSISWLIPSTGLPAYVAAKAAIVGLTRTMAHELGDSNIRVNAVLPGGVLTERQQRLWRTPEYDRKILNSQCIHRDLLPEDVARLVLFLAADDSSAITNQTHVIDAGWI